MILCTVQTFSSVQIYNTSGISTAPFPLMHKSRWIKTFVIMGIIVNKLIEFKTIGNMV